MSTIECDVVVVGAGSAGCVMASRLAREQSRSVVLLEAGPDYGHYVSGAWPPDLLDYRTIPTSHDWGFWNDVRPQGGGAYPLSCAKVIGGSSSHNACGILWPRKADVEQWVGAGCEGWTWEALLPFLQGVETTLDGNPGKSRGKVGPVPVTTLPTESLPGMYRTVLDATGDLGLAFVDDLNDATVTEGVGRTSWNIHRGVRWNASFAYIDPLREQGNLKILARSLAARILVRNGQAIGVQARSSDGTDIEIRAAKTVITAGAYNTPALLQRSGIGPSAILEHLGIAPVAHVPGVGSHLSDHPVIPLKYLATQLGFDEGRRMAARGLPSRSPIELLLHSPYSEVGADVHVTLSPGSEVQDGWEYLVRVELFRPKSMGSVRVTSIDPDVSPRIDSQLLSTPTDIAVASWGVSQVRAIMSSAKMKDWIASERPLRNSQQLRPEDLAAMAYTYHHPTSTCRMGAADDPTAVVDQAGRVRGVSSLVVADASVLPEIPAALPNLTVLAVADRIASLHA